VASKILVEGIDWTMTSITTKLPDLKDLVVETRQWEMVEFSVEDPANAYEEWFGSDGSCTVIPMRKELRETQVSYYLIDSELEKTLRALVLKSDDIPHEERIAYFLNGLDENLVKRIRYAPGEYGPSPTDRGPCPVVRKTTRCDPTPDLLVEVLREYVNSSLSEVLEALANAEIDQNRKYDLIYLLQPQIDKMGPGKMDEGIKVCLSRSPSKGYRVSKIVSCLISGEKMPHLLRLEAEVYRNEILEDKDGELCKIVSELRNYIVRFEDKELEQSIVRSFSGNQALPRYFHFSEVLDSIFDERELTPFQSMILRTRGLEILCDVGSFVRWNARDSVSIVLDHYSKSKNILIHRLASFVEGQEEYEITKKILDNLASSYICAIEESLHHAIICSDNVFDHYKETRKILSDHLKFIDEVNTGYEDTQEILDTLPVIYVDTLLQWAPHSHYEEIGAFLDEAEEKSGEEAPRCPDLPKAPTFSMAKDFFFLKYPLDW